jgi:LysR family transcriptional regulator, nitrogen assimilation regulatory protein
VDLKQLRYFLQVIDSGSFSSASSVLHIAQPALSRQIKSLEDELGVTLLHRTGRGVVLTSAGQALAGGAGQLIDDMAELRRTMMGFRSTLAGEATVGLTPTIGRILSIPLMRSVQALYPMVKLRIAEGFSGTMLEWLHSGRIDAAVLYEDPHVSTIHVDHVADETLTLITRAADAPEGATVSMETLSPQPLILPTPNHGLRKLIDRYAGQSGLALNVAFEVDSLYAIVEAVQNGMAWTILPQAAVRSEIESGALAARGLVNPELIRPLLVATAAQRSDAITSRELGRLLRQQMIAIMDDAGWRRPAPPPAD